MDKKALTAFAVGTILCASSFVVGRCSRPGMTKDNNEVVVDSITTNSVISDLHPTIRDSIVLRYRYVDIPKEHSMRPNDSIPSIKVDDVGEDSVKISIPITQKRYEGENYLAYVSGYDPRLDSIFVTSTTTTITVREQAKPKRFSIGIHAGYGYTPKGFQPYVGIGIGVNLFSF